MAFSLAVVTLVTALAAAHAASQSPDSPAATNKSPDQVTLTGCLQAAPKGEGFVLTDVRPSSAGTKDSSLTSAGAGTSATGETPSGTVTGKTPTGSTATGTSGETPSGAPGTAASPASPTYNQGDSTTGSTGTVPRPDAANETPVRKYRVVAEPGVGLKAHTGHTVEIQGSLKPTAATPDSEPAPREGRGSATAEPTSEMREPLIEVTTVRHVAAGCQR
jgi:hypothetical protein